MTIKGAGVSLSGVVELIGFGSGVLRVRLVARRHMATLAVNGRWTWTHGGGPGSDTLPVCRTPRTEWTWPLAARAVGTLAPPIPEKR